MKTRIYQVPKRCGTILHLYGTYCASELKEKNPNIIKDDILKTIRGMWSKLTKDERNKYSELQEKAKEKYESFLKEFNEKGYYTTEARQRKVNKTKSRNNSDENSKRAKQIKK